MTPEELSIFFINHGFHLKMKSWISSNGDCKYKLAKNSLQKFIKGGSGWIKVRSIYYKDITMNLEVNKLHFNKVI